MLVVRCQWQRAHPRRVPTRAGPALPRDACSHTAAAAAAAAGHDRLIESGVLELAGHVIDGGESGVQPGDIFAFAGETPHIAEARDCGRDAGGCLRLILSFAGDNARYVSGRRTSLLPMAGDHVDGDALHGPTFPEVDPLSLSRWMCVRACGPPCVPV